MQIFLQFLIKFLKSFIEILVKSCAGRTKTEPEVKKVKKHRKRTTSISKTTTENFKIETISTSTDSPTIDDKK